MKKVLNQCHLNLYVIQQNYSHGHVISLIQNGIKTIFYPCIPYSRKEYEDANNRYNCPIVISYSEVLKNNIEELKSEDIKFINPFYHLNQKHY